MENTAPLHAQKVTILSRLIKESSLTLEEALILLKEEEVKQGSAPLSGTISTSPYWGTVNSLFLLLVANFLQSGNLIISGLGAGPDPRISILSGATGPEPIFVTGFLDFFFRKSPRFIFCKILKN